MRGFSDIIAGIVLAALLATLLLGVLHQPRHPCVPAVLAGSVLLAGCTVGNHGVSDGGHDRD